MLGGVSYVYITKSKTFVSFLLLLSCKSTYEMGDIAIVIAEDKSHLEELIKFLGIENRIGFLPLGSGLAISHKRRYYYIMRPLRIEWYFKACPERG